MSIAALDWVFKQDIHPSWLKFTLVALADCAGDEGECWPSIAHICATTSLDRKTVIKALDQLTVLGYLAETGEKRGRTKQVKVYILKDTVGGTIRRVPPVPSKSTVCPSKESRARYTEPSRTVIEPSERKLTSRKKWEERLAGYRPMDGRRKWHAFWGPRPDSLGDGHIIPKDLLTEWRASEAGAM